MHANAYQNVSKAEKIPPRKHFFAILIYFMLIAYLIVTDQPRLASGILLTVVALAYLGYLRLTVKDGF